MMLGIYCGDGPELTISMSWVASRLIWAGVVGSMGRGLWGHSRCGEAESMSEALITRQGQNYPSPNHKRGQGKPHLRPVNPDSRTGAENSHKSVRLTPWPCWVSTSVYSKFCRDANWSTIYGSSLDWSLAAVKLLPAQHFGEIHHQTPLSS